MKMLTSVIRPHKLDELREALERVGVSGTTVPDVRGVGRQKGQTRLYRGAAYAAA